MYTLNKKNLQERTDQLYLFAFKTVRILKNSFQLFISNKPNMLFLCDIIVLSLTDTTTWTQMIQPLYVPLLV